MTTTDLSKKQLATILSAFDDAPRNPANRDEALRAIGRSAQRFGLSTDDVLACAPGLLDGRLSPAAFRVELHDLAGAPAPPRRRLRAPRTRRTRVPRLRHRRRPSRQPRPPRRAAWPRAGRRLQRPSLQSGPRT